jgi:hypothetical protein
MRDSMRRDGAECSVNMRCGGAGGEGEEKAALDRALGLPPRGCRGARPAQKIQGQKRYQFSLKVNKQVILSEF